SPDDAPARIIQRLDSVNGVWLRPIDNHNNFKRLVTLAKHALNRAQQQHRPIEGWYYNGDKGLVTSERLHSDLPSQNQVRTRTPQDAFSLGITSNLEASLTTFSQLGHPGE